MKTPQKNKNLLYEYATLGSELIIMLAIAVYVGWWIDNRLHVKIPLLVWILPLLVIIALIVKVIKDTSKK